MDASLFYLCFCQLTHHKHFLFSHLPPQKQQQKNNNNNLGFSIFAIGVADADYSELLNIGSKPSERHVFFVDDFDAFKKIEDELITFVCETASAS